MKICSFFLYKLISAFILIFWILFFQSSQVSAESNVNASATKSEEKIGDGRYSNHSLDEVAGMIRGTISAYETKVSMHHAVICL